MLKVEHQKDYLKGVNSEIVDLLKEEQLTNGRSSLKRVKRFDNGEQLSKDSFTNIDVSRDGSCLFWAVTLAYLIPVKYNDDSFKERFERLFRNVNPAELEKIQDLIKNYNPSSKNSVATSSSDPKLKDLVTKQFRNIVINTISNDKEKFQDTISINDIFASKNKDYIDKFVDDFSSRFNSKISEYSIDINKLKSDQENEVNDQLKKINDPGFDNSDIRQFIFDKYIECMKDPGSWGGNHEIEVMVEILECNIVVFSEFDPLLFSRYDNNDQIYLFNYGESHYNFGLVKAEKLIGAIRDDNNKVKIYLNTGIDNINYSDNEGWTALHFAAQKGSQDTVQILLDRGAKTNVRNRLQQTPLDIAMSFYQENSVNDRNHHLDIAVSLLIKGAHAEGLSDQGKRILQDYIKKFHPGVGVIESHPNVINLLSAPQPGPSNINQANQPDVKGRQIIKDRRKSNNMKLLVAARTGNIDNIKSSISEGADVNFQDPEGNTALHYAVEGSKLEVVRLLLDNKANINIENNLQVALSLLPERVPNEVNNNLEVAICLLNSISGINKYLQSFDKKEMLIQYTNKFVYQNGVDLDKFLLLSLLLPEEEFKDKYRKLYSNHNKPVDYDKEEKKYYYTDESGKVYIERKDVNYKKVTSLYLSVLSKVKGLTERGDVDILKNLSVLIASITKIEKKTLLETIFNKEDNPIKDTNLIILACKHNQSKILEYLLSNEGSNLLKNLSDYINKSPIKPTDIDRENHNAFYYAIRSDDVDILERLYDYWSGNLHWSVSQTKDHGEYMVNNFRELNRLIKDACNNYEGELDNQVRVDIHGIVKFSSFQIELYNELTRISDEKSETERIKNILLTVFDVYKKYSKEDEIRLPKIPPEDEEKMKQNFLDKTTLYWESLLYQMYQSYFRKLDFNVSLLILDNLHLLKQRLKIPEGTYQKIELKLYHFITSINNGWKEIYLPEREKTKKMSVHSDAYELNYSQVLYLEKMDFQKHLDEFSNILKKTSITNDNIRKEGSKIPNEEINSLELSPYLDTFSLDKIFQYIEVLPSDSEDKSEQLIIERALQVVGEFLKGTDESFHLQHTTQALLQAELSIETFKQLTKLRDLLSHVKEGQLLARIDIEDYKSDVFTQIYQDLQEIKKCISKVYDMRKPLLHKLLIQQGIKLLVHRYEEILNKTDNDNEIKIRFEIKFSSIRDIYCLILTSENPHFLNSYEIPEHILQLLFVHFLSQKVFLGVGPIPLDLLHKYINSKFKEISEKSVFSDSLIEEIRCNLLNQALLLVKLEKVKESIIYTFASNLEEYTNIIQNEIESIKSNGIGKFEDLEPQFSFIKGLLELIVIENKFLDDHHWEIKHSQFSRNVDELLISHDSKTVVEKVDFVLYHIKSTLDDILHHIKSTLDDNTMESRENVFITEEINRKNEFQGIQKLKEILERTNFLAEEEKKYLLQNVPEEKKEVGDAKSCLIKYYEVKYTLEEDKYKELIDKLQVAPSVKIDLKRGFGDKENFLSYKKTVEDSHDYYQELSTSLIENNPITGEDYNKFVSAFFQQDNKSKKYMLNLVKGKQRDPMLLKCLDNRISLLQNTLVTISGQSINEQLKTRLVLHYMHDRKFRALVEMLFSDVTNIYQEAHIKQIPLSKSSGLLTGINLRNVLQHGNPLLEVVGNVLDRNDLPTELISKTLIFIRDAESIKALKKLEEMVTEDIKKLIINGPVQNDGQKGLVSKFKESKNWEALLSLVQNHDQDMTNNKSVDGQIDNQKDIELINEIKKKTTNPDLVQDLIQNQGANVDFIDQYGKAAIHYASMSGKNEIIRVLLENNADVNVANEKDKKRRPLHYAAMNGQTEAVKILLERGADVFATDEDDRGVLYYADKYKGKDTFLLLARHLVMQVGYNLRECLPSTSSGRSRREAIGEKCLFTWEDVDEFNEEKDEKRDLSKIKIDSERFVSYIKDLPEGKQSQLIQLADKIRVAGNSQSLVSKLISNQKVISHLNRVGRVSGMTMHGMMAKNVLADFLNGDYQGVAINVGFIAGGQGFAKVAEAASIKGLKLASEGKLLLGRSLRAASPFLARGTSAFVVYDLVNQIKAFKNGTEEALVGIVGDSIYLGVDAAEIGIEIAEAFEVLEGVSSVTGPIGATIGAVVFVGTDIYMAVKRVDKIDEIIHLTGKERFVEGLRAFIGMEPEKHIEELIEEKQLNNQLVKQGLEYLQQHSDIQRYVFPTGKSVVDSCNKVQQSKRVCVSPGFNGCTRARTVTSYTEKCTTKFEEDLDNTVLLDRRRTDIKWSRAKPDNPRGGQLFCLPQGNYEPVPNYGSYLCKSAIGLSTNKTGGYTLINLGEGEDYVKGFIDNPNIFVVNNGSKKYHGGNKDDIFILQGSSITGYFYGEGGVNTLDLTSFAPEKESIDVKLHVGQVEDYYQDNSFGMSGINRFLGRKGKADRMFITCDSSTSDIKFVDGQGGSERFVDHIKIDDKDCAYEMQIVVRPNTVVYNRALKGDFHYIVPYALGNAKIDFIYTAEALNLNNTFAFEYEPVQIKNVDVRNINVLNKTSHIITFNFSPMSDKEFNITISGASNPSYRLGNNTEIKVGNKGNLYMLENTNKSVDEIIKDYLVVANRLNKMSFFIQSLLNNETVAIGSGNYEVIHNNPLQKSHLVGNGGENVYVIDSENKRFEIPLPEVVIYDLDVESSVDTVDLRNLVQQTKGEFSNSFKLQILKSANDLLLKATVEKSIEDSSISEKHEYFTVRLKDGVNWYNKTHVIMDNVPMRINLDNNEWSLKPLPLVFEKDKEVIIVTSQDVEENTELITPRKGGNYTFVRSNSNDLMITNAFDTKDDLCTITLSKFYEEPKMGTLSIKFADKEIILKEHQEQISSARNVNVVKKEHKEQVYHDVFNRTEPEVMMLSDQPVAHEHKHRHSGHRHQVRHRRNNDVASSSAKPSSWINNLFGWVKSSVSGLLGSKSKETSSTTSPILQVDAKMDVNGTIMLLDVIVRKFTGKQYIPAVDQSIPLLEARGYALNITNRFEKVLNKTAIKSGISVTNLNFDPVVVQSAIIGKIINGKFSEIAKTLYSFAKEACPEFKQTDKFLDHLKGNLEEVLAKEETMILQQKVEKPSKVLGQEVSRKVQLSKKPDTFLNGTSVVQGISRAIN